VKRVSCHRKLHHHTPLSVIFVFSFVLVQVNGADISCQGIRYTYSNKGLDTSDIPVAPQQGIHLKICPRGVTCCTPEMETKLWTLSRDTYTQALEASTAHLQATFQEKSKKFDEFFTELLARSKRDFHFMFKKTYGILYERNSDVFTEFFKDLERYYQYGNIDLEEALRKFFSQLYQRMFTVLNSQYSFDGTYLECVSKNMKKLQPFGDVPKKLTLQLRRSFVATRTFSQALQEGKKILAKIMEIPPRDKCVEALTKMTSCPACQGLPAIRPCSGYCQNVMKGCLAYHTELSDSWDKYIDNLISVGERLNGPFNIETVVEPIDIKISDAIMNFQESGYEVTQKVFQDCGQPRLGKRQAVSYSYNNYQPFMAPSMDRSHNMVVPPTGTSLETLVTDIISKVKDSRNFWTRLPNILCQNPEVGAGKDQVEQNCWNGRDRGTYTARLTGDGLSAQDQNPEVDVDSSRPDTRINEQKLNLKLASNKLENAYNGHSVEWPHYESNFPNTSPYEGSGADPECFDDEDCYTEGSGSGVKNRYDDIEDNEGSGYSDDEDDDDEEEDTDEFEVQWPPWLNKDQKEDKPDIIFQDPRTTLRPRPNVVVQTTAGAGKVIAICLPVMLIHVARVLL